MSDILVFVPHQDDEILTFGVAIIQAVAAGHNVHVTVCTDGSLDGSRGRLNSGEECELNTWHEGRFRFHEGVHCYDLSIAEFVACRDEEFRSGCIAMGVPAENIHIPEKRAADGSLSVEVAASIICEQLRQYPDAIVVTEAFGSGAIYNPLDPGACEGDGGVGYHVDHHTLGLAVKQLFDCGLIQEARFYADPYRIARFKEEDVGYTYCKQAPSEEEYNKVNEVIAGYKMWAPEKKRFAIGFHSAHILFPEVSCDYNNYVRVMRRKAN